MPQLLSVRTTSTLDAAVADAIAPAPLWDSNSMKALDGGALHHDEDKLKVEFCGETQRLSFYNQTCEVALNLIQQGSLAALKGMPYRASDGAEVLASSSGDKPRCSIREPRVFKPSCSRGTCNASGLCTAQQAPSVLEYHAP